jgi:hypothetical protein
MSQFLGRRNDLAVFANDSNYVEIDTQLNVVVASGYTADFVASELTKTFEEHPMVVVSLAQDALSILEPRPVVASARLYTIPEGVQKEAQKSLEWRKEHKRGGTPVGMNTARTLAKGGQIGIEKVRHIAKYFPRHEVDKKGKGWKPGEDNFPSNGRIAWALWGGDAARRWASAIVERDNKKALKADAYMETAGAELESFAMTREIDDSIAPDFLARVDMDGSGIDRIYKIDLDGRVYIWDDGTWDDLGVVGGDVWLYDGVLDASDGYGEHSHVVVDPESAIVICARLQSNPFNKVLISDIDPEEALLFEDAEDEEDWEFIDNSIVAATPPPADGYTSTERSENVKKQVRDARGLFVKMGNKVVVGGDADKGSGEIVGFNEDGTVKVRLNDGREIDVDPKLTETVKQGADKGKGGIINRAQSDEEPLDVSGILGEPRTPTNQPKAYLSQTLPPITTESLHSMLSDWDNWVRDQRLNSGGDKTNERAEHPLVSRLYQRGGSKSIKDASDNKWATPVVSAATPEKTTSDVQPLYLALVSPEDPRAVMDLVAVVPASATSTSPMTYVRDKKKWNRKPEILADLKSATPPPVVPLKNEYLQDVLKQVDTLVASASLSYDHTLMVLWGPNREVMQSREDEFFAYSESLFAEGGLDRNRGQAEGLRRYWTTGKGGAKIRWGTPGDWKRCVRYLSKYLGVRAKGYCQLRHKDATGIYTGSRRNPGNENSMEQPMYGFPDVDMIEIAEDDLMIPLDEIMKESDDLYEATWEPEQEIIESLKVINQCSDEEFEALVASSYLNNRRKEKKLRKYWTTGRGAAKIRWNTGGDWYRCVRYLSKYLGRRAKGYCALRHKEVTGMWTGDRPHLIMYGGKVGNRGSFSADTLKTSEQIMDGAYLSAKALQIKESMGLVASVGVDEAGFGPRFVIPLVIPEETESGDGRSFKKGAISWRELPLPLMWQIQTSDGHNGSVVVGRIDHMERTENGIGNCHGVFDSGQHANEVVRLIKNGFIKGVSADMDRFEATEVKSKVSTNAEDDKSIGKDKIVINKARVMGVTIVPKPAFQECKIMLDEGINSQEEPMISDGIYVDDVDASDAQSLVACGFVAGAIPLIPPKQWFENPKFDKATPLTVTDDGRVFGHIAAWHVDHIGLSYGTKPPRSKSNYAYFHTGVVRTEEGADMPVGQLTLAGGHASLEASAVEAVKHYDDTASAFADVHAGEDAHGIWVSGSLRPGTSPEQIRAIRASAPSGDWRPIRGSLELVAVCQVNVPGFPVARARVASGAVTALVAAGAMTLAKMKSDPVVELNERLARLEKSQNFEMSAKVQSAKATFANLKEQRNAELNSKAQELSAKLDSVFAYEDEFTMSRRERKALAEEGKAMEDGSFPIRNVSDLKNAIQSHGRASEGKRASVKRFIEKRARQLKRIDLIPEEWKTASNMEFTSRIESMRSAIADATVLVAAVPAEDGVAPEVAPEIQDVPTPSEQAPVAEEVVSPGKSSAVEPEEVGDVNAPTVESGLKVDGVYTPKTQPRDAKGKFRQVLARLKSDIGTSGLQNIVEEARTVGAYYELGDYVNSAGSAVKLMDIIGRLDSGALNSDSLENVRASAAELGKVIANLPLGFNDQTEKVRYSDLPSSLQNLMDDMMEKVEAKIGKDDAKIANADLEAFRSGSDVFSQGEISGQMSKLLRLLT